MEGEHKHWHCLASPASHCLVEGKFLYILVALLSLSVSQDRKICYNPLVVSSLPNVVHSIRIGGSCYRVSCHCLRGPSNPCCAGFVVSPQLFFRRNCRTDWHRLVFMDEERWGSSCSIILDPLAMLSSTATSLPALRMGRTNSFKWTPISFLLKPGLSPITASYPHPKVLNILTNPAWLPTQVPLLSLVPQPQSYLLSPPPGLFTIILFPLMLSKLFLSFSKSFPPREMPFHLSQLSEIPSTLQATLTVLPSPFP